MGLHIKKVGLFKRRALLIVVIGALFMQPVYGLVAGQVASAVVVSESKIPRNLYFAKSGESIANNSVINSKSGVSLHWDRVDGANRYRITVKHPDNSTATWNQNSTATWNPARWTFQLNNTSYADGKDRKGYFGERGEGIYSYTIESKDEATGEWSSASETVALTYDVTSPTLEAIQFNGRNLTSGGVVGVSGSFIVSLGENNPNRTYVEVQKKVNNKWQKIAGRLSSGEAANAATLEFDAKGLVEDAEYQLKISTDDAAWNHAKGFVVPLVIDNTSPTVTIKSSSEIAGHENGGQELVYNRISFKLFDKYKVDKVVLNGHEKNLTDNSYSDLNDVNPGKFGAREGKNVLTVFDVTGNSTEVTFTLNGTSVCTTTGATKGQLQKTFAQFKDLFSEDWGMSDHSCEWGEYNDSSALWHGEAGTKWYLVYESTDSWQTTNGQIEGKTVVGIRTFAEGQPIPVMTGKDFGLKPGDKKVLWVHLVPVSESFAPTVGSPYPRDAAYTRAWAQTTIEAENTDSSAANSNENSSSTDTSYTARNTSSILASSGTSFNRGVALSTNNFTTSNVSQTSGSLTTESADSKTIVTNTAKESDGNTEGQVLGARDDQKEWSLVNLVLAIITVFMSFIALLGVLRKREEDDRRHLIVRTLTLIPAIGAVVIFVLVENISLPIGWVNNWTILMVAIAIIQVILVIKSKRTTE